MPECQHCGEHVSHRYVRVFGNGDAHRCRQCDHPIAIQEGSAAGVEPRICERKRDRFGTDPRHGLWTNVEVESDG